MDTDSAEVQRAVRGLASAWMIDSIGSKYLFVQRFLFATGLLTFILGFVIWRHLQTAVFGLSFLLLAGAVGGVISRWLAIGAVRLFASPRRYRHHEPEFAQALVDADIPTGPFSAVRFLLRLKRGARQEKTRLTELTKHVLKIIDPASDLDASPDQ